MYRPTTRVLALLELLQSHNRLTGAEVARRLEVHTRTVRRYVEILQDLGIPVQAERGRYGAYGLHPGFKLPPLMFSEDEALAVTLGLLAVRRLGLAVAAPAVETTLAKIERMLPIAIRDRIEAVQEMLVLHLGVQQAAPVSAAILTLSAAANSASRVRLRYQSHGGEETERSVDPYGVVYHSGMWYVAGYCHLRAGLRTFRLDRVLGVSVPEDAESFTVPPDFDALNYVLGSLAATPHALHLTATLCMTIEEARRKVPATLATLDEVDGGVVMRCYADDPDWMASVLAGLGCRFVVHEPPEVRDALRRLALSLLSMADAGDTVTAHTEQQGLHILDKGE